MYFRNGDIYHQFLFSIINAAITPGTHPHNVSRNTIMKEPHPWSITAKGGNMIASITRRQDINHVFFDGANILNLKKIGNYIKIMPIVCHSVS